MPKDLEGNEEFHQFKRLEFARQRLLGFIKYTFPEYDIGWVHKEISMKLDRFLDAVAEKKSPRLMLMMPPRHGKTEIVSRRFPAYSLGRYPDLSIIATSYSSELSSRNNLDVQRIVDTKEYKALFPSVRLPRVGERSGSKFRRTSELFEIVGRKGSYRSAGVGGSITGMGANILIIDDPIKDRLEADSPTTRDRIYSWYKEVARTRLEPGGGIIVIMTRWHTDDLCGRLLNTADNAWEVIEYPAIAVRDEEHRKTGEALHPSRYSLEELLDLKKDAGTRGWEALYQQHPIIEGGAIFKEKWFKHYTVLPRKFDRKLMSWDMSFKNTSDSDFVVGQVWGRIDAEYYLIDQVRGRMDFTQSLAAVIDLAKKYRDVSKKLIEDKANGTGIINVLKNKVPGIVGINPKDSKISRAYAVTPFFEAGNIYLPDQTIAPWITDYERELLQFPTGAHDDQVDATTQAINEMVRRQPLEFDPRNIDLLGH